MRRLGLKKKTPTPEENAKISDSKKAKKPCSSVTNADAFPDYARRRKKRCATKDIEPLLKVKRSVSLCEICSLKILGCTGGQRHQRSFILSGQMERTYCRTSI